MNNILQKIKKELTPKRRKAIYGAMTAIITLLVAFGVITAEEIDSTISSIVSLLTAATTLLAFINTETQNKDEEEPTE